jgi:hypothetical protein
MPGYSSTSLPRRSRARRRPNSFVVAGMAEAIALFVSAQGKTPTYGFVPAITRW